MFQEFLRNSQVEVGDYSDKNESPSDAKDSVTFYADNSSEPVTLYPEASDQYFTSHQNDKILRNLGDHQLQLVPAPAEPEMSSILNRNEYKISLRTSSGREEVVLLGNKPLFMKTVKSEVMKFLNEYQVPIATFCERILNKSETSSFSAFFTIDNWDLLRDEDRMTYYNLSKWIAEPATKRMFDFIQKEPDVTKKTKMTNSYVELTTVPRSTSALSLDLPDVEITPVSAYRNVDSVGFGGGVKSRTTAVPPKISLATGNVPNIARTVTTLPERVRIKQWSLENPEATARERSVLAQEMGVTKGTVDRIINYEKKVRGIKEDPKAQGSKTENVKQQVKPPGPTITEQSKEIFVGNRESRIKTAIQEAVKTGALKVDDLKKSYKIVVKTRIADNQYEQEVHTKQSEPILRSPPRSVDLKYNRIALDSYFKNKPNPTPEEIDHFVSCTKVPKDVTLAFLSERERQSSVDDTTINTTKSSSNPVEKQEELSTFPINAEPTPRGIIPKLTDEQKVWFDHFLLRNPAPDMQAIIEFSKTTGMPFETVALILECWNFEDHQSSPSSEREEILGNLEPDTANLLRDIHQFTAEDFPPALEEELRSMFGKKIFLTLENIKSFAVEKNFQFQDLYKTLTSSCDQVQLVSEETCKRLLAVEKEEEEEGSQASPAPANNWLTNNELMFEQSDEEEESQANLGMERGERTDENLKRKSPERNFSPSKKLRTDEDNDSGYLTPDDVSNNSDLLSNIIMENIGEVNMLNDSLDLFNESIQNIDLVNEMYEKVEDQDRSELVDHLKPKTAEKLQDFESLLKEALEGLQTEDNLEKTPVKEQEDGDLSDLRKVFYGPFQNFQPVFQIINIQESCLNNKLFEVELSNGKESSRNFYFKSRASELKINQRIKLKQLRYVGSRICVETFQVLDLPPCENEKPILIEESFFRKIRSAKVESFELSEVEAPRTIMEYICLEENLKTFMETNGFYLDDRDQIEKSKKMEILFKLCQAKVNLSSKILKLLSKLLKIEKEEIEKFFIEYLSKIENSPQMMKQDHCYVNMYTCFI